MKQWGWMSGVSEVDVVSIPGPKETPSTIITPSGTSYAGSWSFQPVGSAFLYFGFGGKSNKAYSDEIWRYNTNTLEWTLMKGNEDWSTSVTNRTGAAVWGTENGDVWIFGGEGYDASDNKGMTINSNALANAK